MKLLQLQYFKMVCETGSMTKAAANLHVAQPALGLQIAQLEEALGVSLLRRHSRGVTPTPAGDSLYLHATKILADIKTASAEVRSFAETVEHEALSIGFAPSVLLLLGSDILTEARRTMPNITLAIIEQPSFALTEAVARGEMDAAFVSEIVVQPNATCIPMFTETLLFVTGARYGFADEEIEVIDMLDWDLVLAGPRDPIRQRVMRLAESVGLSPRVPFEVQSVSVIKKLLLQRRVAGILPYGTVHEEVHDGILRVAQIKEPDMNRTICLVRSVSRPVFRYEAEFRIFIESIMNKLSEFIGLLGKRV